MPPQLRTGHRCDSKVHGANMGPSWAPMLAPLTLLPGQTRIYIYNNTDLLYLNPWCHPKSTWRYYLQPYVHSSYDRLVQIYVYSYHFHQRMAVIIPSEDGFKSGYHNNANCRRHCFLKILSTCELIAGQLRPILGIPWTYPVLIVLEGKWNSNQKDGRRVYPWRYSDYIVCHM